MSTTSNRPGRRPALTAEEREALKVEMASLLEDYKAAQEAKAMAENALDTACEAVYKRIGSAKFTVGGSVMQAAKRADGTFTIKPVRETAVLEVA